MTQSKSRIKNSKLFDMYVALLLTHIATIFKFGGVSGPMAAK